MSISGKKIGCKIGSSAIGGIYRARARFTPDVLDATNGGGGGFQDTDVGTLGVEVEFAGWFDTTSGAVGAVLPGTIIANFKFFRNLSDTTEAILMPSAIVTAFELGGEARGRVDFTAKVANKGTYTYNDPS